MKKLILPLTGVLFLVLASCEVTLSRNLHIVSGSENKPLEPLLEEFTRETGIGIDMEYLGSVDIMMSLQDGNLDADAVWPANGLWVTLGDKAKQIKHSQSIFTSPVAFGVRRSKAELLGWIGRDIRVADILEAIRAGRLSFMMTSATQSNSGASAYLGFLYALLGNPEVISPSDLDSPELAQSIQDLMGGINRSSGSSGWLKELFLNTPDAEAMVNYESVLIETNQELLAQGKEPLYFIYPMDGMVISDSPLGFNSLRDQEKEESFQALQRWLLRPEIQDRLFELGRRTGLGGELTGANPAVFNPEWGIDPERLISPVRLPSAEVIERSLLLYQTGYRKPSFTIFAVDYSGSMDGEGERLLEEAMRLLLDPATARRYMLQASNRDKWVILPFSDEIKSEVAMGAQPLLDMKVLDPAVVEKARELAKTIRIDDSQAVIQYAVGTQSKISQFADNILEEVRSKDAGYVGETMTNLLMKIKAIDIGSLGDGGFWSKVPIIGALVNSIQKFIARYDKMSVQIEKVVSDLDKARMNLLRDITMLDGLFQKNQEYLKELDLYIAAGAFKLEELRSVELPKLQAKAQASGDPADAQKLHDFTQLLNRFEKKLHDLKLSRMITIQTAPQIRLIQNNNQVLVEKVQSSILNTIPLWKNQIIIAISLFRQEKSLKLQKEVTDTTNDLMAKNSEMLKQGSLGVARESERGIVEIQTLNKVNADLISTIEETLKIQSEGKAQRAQAEQELLQMEGQLKARLSDIKSLS